MEDRSDESVRGVFANRTLNLRSVQAIVYDMDYTLIHYRVEEWERAAFDHARRWLTEAGWPVEDLTFDPDAFTLGLVFDLDLGNLAKATRFGYVVKAQHGSTVLSFEEQRAAYAETVVDLAEERFDFMNTMFELSRAALFTQCVDLFDRGQLAGVRSYHDLYRRSTLRSDGLTSKASSRQRSWPTPNASSNPTARSSRPFSISVSLAVSSC